MAGRGLAEDLLHVEAPHESRRDGAWRVILHHLADGQAAREHSAVRSAASSQRGFTLAEVLIAVAVIGIGLAAISMGFGIATSGVEVGRQQTTAVLLAEQRVEQLRTLVIANFVNVAIAAGTTQEAYGAIPNGPGYRRQTTIGDIDTNGDGIIDMKRVQVVVFYRPITERGTQGERQVTLVDVITRRQ
jgi:prepilin-type N-terminal cleavage/methylation domain-containing protein